MTLRYVVSVMVLAAACSANRADEYPSPVRLGFERDELPAPGLCRIVGQAQRSCEGIALTAPQGSRILYRMKDDSRLVVLCYMHPGERGLIYGIDVFDVLNQRLVDVVLRADDEPIRADCDQAVAGRRIQRRS